MATSRKARRAALYKTNKPNFERSVEIVQGDIGAWQAWTPGCIPDINHDLAPSARSQIQGLRMDTKPTAVRSLVPTEHVASQPSSRTQAQRDQERALDEKLRLEMFGPAIKLSTEELWRQMCAVWQRQRDLKYGAAFSHAEQEPPRHARMAVPTSRHT